MKRALPLIALLVLVVAGSVSAATFPVTKVAEDATTITLGWTPVAGADGYRFYANGVAVSRTFDPSRRTVRFSKGATEYRVEVLHVTGGDVGTYPPVVVPPPPPPPPPPPAGQVFVAPTGNDSAACTAAAPCKTIQRAANQAKDGDIVNVAPGNYAAQQLVDVKKAITVTGAGKATFAGQLVLRCNTGVTVDGIKSKTLLVSSGNRSLTVRNSEFGGGPWTTGVEEDPVVISGDNQHACSSGFENRGIVLDNVYVHDYFWQQDPGTGPHPDCLQFYGGSVNVTIRNSRFERCAESFIGAYPDFGDIRDVLIENTTFSQIGCQPNSKGTCTYFASQWGQPGHQYRCENITIRGTTWSPGVPYPLRSECRNFVVEGNTFQVGPGSGCQAWNQSQGGVVWRNNTFLNGGACST